ncbi:MAG: S49 family peptidase [candidate division Zixibacteria bacterium]|nr:S49 family peptidase [candidate division Zixibacteria bacterium]
MHLVRYLLSILMSMAFCVIAYSQGIPSFYSQNDFLQASPSIFNYGLSGFSNPANLAYLKNGDFRYYQSTDGTDMASRKNWGIFASGPGFGFGAVHQKFGDYKNTDYRISLGFGDDKGAVGFGYGWSNANIDSLESEKIFKSSMIMRPVKYLSIGLTGDFSFESKARQGVAEIGIRPLGTSRLTLFADMAMQKDTKFKDAPWSAGAVVEVVPGINISGRYFDSEAFTAGLSVEFGKGGIASQLHFDDSQEHSYSSYSIRLGDIKPSIFNNYIGKESKYLKMKLKGRLNYQKYAFFDKNSQRFMDILQDIKAASDDPRISAIALNLSGMRVVPEHAWEIREELKNAQAKGKTVIIFIDNVSMTIYHLASVADKIVLDPEGIIYLMGYSLSNTYFKGTLEKLGLAFDEWRFFKYKSAAEALSRDSMSEADREQRQDYVDDLYETARDEICKSRSITSSKFDHLVDEQIIFLPNTAIENGLVDTLARWSDIAKVIKNLTGKKLSAISSGKLLANALPSSEWGPKPVIAVVYGLGICAMDSGIKARWLENVFLKLAKNKSVKAVVFRVDSPGGDGMASDLVAEALKKCAEKKPVIISQGQVAGSGGYWISMYGDEIVAGPNTITGSIGVIGGWIYDKGFGDKLGMTSDLVQRGKHADLGKGVNLPFINMTVPARNLTQDERGIAEKFIKEFYEIFVAKVAAGRNMSVDEVKEIAQGHFYSGLDGKKIGLVDEVGGLFTAMAIAMEKAGLQPDQEVDIREIPKHKGLFYFKSPMPFTGVNLDYDPVFRYIRMISDHNGKPLPMLTPGTYPEVE